MVFFTCNHCGEAVKKPAVEKHYLTKCRGAPKSVSCMDCQKDFQDNYVEHIKCITEMQKYSGKDYVPKASANSGAKKQEGWTEVVRSVLDSKEYDLNGEMRKAFLTLQNYDNIPRKKPKFMNFVTNSVRLQKRIVGEVWSILEKEQEKMKQARQAQQAQKTNVNNGKVDETKQKVEGNEKASSSSNENEQNEIDNAESEQHDDENQKKKKNKKKKKQKEAENKNEVAEVENTELTNGKKKKQKQEEKEANAIETIQQNGHSEPNKKEKKKLKKKIETVNSSENGTNEPPSKKRKKGEIQADFQTNETTKSMDENPNTFCWENELVRMTVKYPDGVAFEKLKKKIEKKFKLKLNQTDLTERQEKGFIRKLNKKLMKSTILRLEGDMVKPYS